MEDLLAPENFSMVEQGVYRSAFPRSKNTPFLRTLRLRSVLPLIPEDYPQSLIDFYNGQKIELLKHGLLGNKWPFKEIDMRDLMDAIIDLLNPEKRPILVHCNKGKHRTGSIIGCLRKIRGWSLAAIFSEYVLFAAPKSRIEDQIFIEAFDVAEFSSFAQSKASPAAIVIANAEIINNLSAVKGQVVCNNEEQLLI